MEYLDCGAIHPNNYRLSIGNEAETYLIEAISAEEVFERMRAIARIMHNAIQLGIAGTEYADRILPAQAPLLKAAIDEKRAPDDIVNRMTLL